MTWKRNVPQSNPKEKKNSWHKAQPTFSSSKIIRAALEKSPNPLFLLFSFSSVRKASEGLTFVGTKAIFAVFVEVVGGGAPQEAVIATLRRATVVLGAHEQEGELAEFSIGVAVFHLHHCRKGIEDQ